MSDLTGQINAVLPIPPHPLRIISLVPSITELLHSLGLEERVVGITKFCVHPDSWFRTKARIGGTKQVDFNTIASLSPDLIIANKEENVKEQVEELASRYPVWLTDVKDYEDAVFMIRQLGKICNKEATANELCKNIRQAFAALPVFTNKIRTAYLIWKAPWMTVGGDTFIHHMMEKAGYDNVFAGQERYPEITIEILQAARPELILLSSEPYPFRQPHIDQLQPLFPGTSIRLADGEMFSWYGSRLLRAPAYFQELRTLS